ncbi:MAG: tetratricopeptide repeat protein [bacterium]
MKSRSIITKIYLISLCFFVFASGETDDFFHGEQAFQNGEYKLAEIYFSHLLANEPFNEHIPDAVYYLTKIYEIQGNFADMISHANRFLEDFKHDRRSKELLHIVLTHLNDAEAYSIALEYIKRLDYLIDDPKVYERIGYGLFQQNRYLSADYILSLCTQTDSVKIIRAQMTNDPYEIMEIYGSIEGAKGLIHLTEFCLEIGDTISAFQSYKKIEHKQLQGNLLYRYAKLSKLFDRRELPKILEKLIITPGFDKKARLLDEQFSFQPFIVPDDQEELRLLIEHLGQDTVMTSLPDTVNIDSIMPDSITKEGLLFLQNTSGNYYFLDSLYCDFLISNSRISEAYVVIKPYLIYKNTQSFTRKVRALKSYADGEYQSAAKDLVLANVKHPMYRFILANSLTRLGFDAIAIYEDLLHATSDSAFISRVYKELLKNYFPAGKYESIAKLDLHMFENDTGLVRIYAHSLVHIGKKHRADSLLSQYLLEPDYNYLNHYGENLIESKKYKAAAVLYDSLISLADKQLPDIIYYNWALIPFAKGQADTALYRFQFFIDDLNENEIYAKTAFKIATIKYLQHEFDSAAFYYDLASKDDDLRLDALQNQLICYKKYGNWSMIIKTGKNILPMTSGDDEVDVLFEIGYGYLRSGYIREAVSYLSKAAKLQPSPEFYYWLAEAHIAKGEFSHGLYQYLRIVDLFPDDEMWTPTAEYKSGIAFELMDELEEAKKIYHGIIQRRGAGDTWGIEAQKRLEELK